MAAAIPANSPPHGRCIGLVGGLGPESAVHYYRGLERAHSEAGAAADVVIVNADRVRVQACMAGADLPGLASYLAGIITRLRAAGAELAAIPAVTPHACLGVLGNMTDVPLVSIIDTTREALLGLKLRRVALFGTRYTVNSDMFGNLAGFEVVRPGEEEIEAVHGIYMAVVEAGEGTSAQMDRLSRIAHRLLGKDGVESIVVAGTDFSPLFARGTVNYPFVDCSEHHIRRIAALSLAGSV
jgi:aspartate racemase